MIFAAAILQNVLAAVYAVQNRSLAKRFPKQQWAVTFWIFLFLIIGGLGIALSLGGIDIRSLTKPSIVTLYLINGICFGAGTGLLYYSFSKLDTAIVQIISSLRIPLVIALSYLILHQRVSLLAIIGALLVICSVVIVSLPQSDQKYHRKAIAIALLTYVMASIGIITEKLTLQKVGLSTFLAISWPSELLWVAISAIIFSGVSAFKLPRQAVRGVGGMALVRIMAGALFIWLLNTSNNTSFVGAILGLSIVLSTLLSNIILKEKRHFWLNFSISITCLIGIALTYI